MNILNFLFPKYCLECGANGKYICDECLKKVSPARSDNTNYSIFKYEGVIRKAIISLKYKFAYDLADELVSVCTRQLISMHYTLNPILIPIPLFWQRQNWRGFNQSEIIGEKLAKQMNWKYVPDLLIRNKNTSPQVGLKGSVRRSNLSGVFKVCSNYTLYPKPCTLVLFDDVYTTGSTINEVKKVLIDAGFKNIKSITIAR